jgi:ElaB/YqjD/DUF883 family membrane-anchored ribosome-binding protein
MASIIEKQVSVEDVINEVARIKDVVTEAVQDGVESAMKAVQQGRAVAGDAIDDARETVKDKPLQAMGIMFASGLLVGCMLGWLSTRRDD